jgi:antitoxin VapB
MKTARLFRHGGSQAVRLPKEFRLEGTEVFIEKRGELVVLRQKAKLKTLGDLARHMRDRFPDVFGFPGREQPKRHQQRDLRLD